MAEPTVPIQIDLPTELIELLASEGDAMLIAFEAVIAEARRIAASGLIQERRELLAQRSTERRVAMSSAGRLAHRLYRRRVAQMPSGLSKADRTEFRSGVKSSIASSMGLAPTLLQIAMARHKSILELEAEALERQMPPSARLLSPSETSLSTQTQGAPRAPEPDATPPLGGTLLVRVVFDGGKIPYRPITSACRDNVGAVLERAPRQPKPYCYHDKWGGNTNQVYDAIRKPKQEWEACYGQKSHNRSEVRIFSQPVYGCNRTDNVQDICHSQLPSAAVVLFSLIFERRHEGCPSIAICVGGSI